MQTFLNTRFASCNGFGGFRSYFSEIFNPKQYVYLLILKGGPGSGKSTFMKALYEKYKGELSAERVLCSSDINSFDGVIIKKKDKAVAVIDGTAPHTQDPRFPGAVDEIINLGEYWNGENLKKQREKIIKLSDEKTMHYNNAYTYLSLIKKEYQSELNCDFWNLIKSRNIKYRIISSFSKDGYFRVPSEKFWSFSKSIDTDIFSASRYLKSKIEKIEGDTLTLFISPFDHSIIEGYFNESTRELILADCEYADEAVALENPREHPIIENNLSLAKNEFFLASMAHFALEDIYTKEMDFERMNSALKEVTKKIESALMT